MKSIKLIRHTTPDIKPGICYGITDLNLASSYDNEIKDVKSRLEGFTPTIIYSSPLIRCRKLASDIYTQLDINVDKRLCEIDFGDWEMKLWNSIPINEMNNWSENLFEHKLPNGESFKNLVDRVLDFWKEHIENCSHDSIAVFTHSGVIRALLMHFLDIPPMNIFTIKLNYGAIVEIESYDKNHSTIKFI